MPNAKLLFVPNTVGIANALEVTCTCKKLNDAERFLGHRENDKSPLNRRSSLHESKTQNANFALDLALDVALTLALTIGEV